MWAEGAEEKIQMDTMGRERRGKASREGDDTNICWRARKREEVEERRTRGRRRII
jgi:hypothetical protein